MSETELDNELINVGLPIQGSRYEKEIRLKNLYNKTGKNKGKKNDKTLSQIEMIAKKREERRAKMETKVSARLLPKIYRKRIKSLLDQKA
jgi:hypothetical protein